MIRGQRPVTSDSLNTSCGIPHSRCTNRFAVGAASSQPAAATSAGLAAAPKETRSGRRRAPTSPWVRGLSAAAWTAGEAVVHSSKKTTEGRVSSATRTAHCGGARSTRPALTTGSPAKSLGS